MQKIDVPYVAELARLKLSDDEIKRFENQLTGILDHVTQLQKLNLEGIEPTAHASPVYNVFRPDIIHDSLPVEDALKNAPQQGNNLIIMPKIVE